MIVHVFTANRYHLVPPIAKGFATIYKDDADHFFVLFGDKTLDKQKYISIFEKAGFSNYVFCQSMQSFVSIIRKYRKSSILFHAGSYHWFILAILLGCKKLNWVCWGSGASSGKGFKSRLMKPVKCWIYNRFDSIITLMDGDRETIIRDFHVSPSKIHTISYMSTGEGKNKLDLLAEQLMQQQRKKKDKIVVLLGNNPTCIEGYIQTLPLLEPYKGKIVVKCMLNYSLVKDKSYERLMRLGTSLFGDDFISSEEFYEDRSEYLRYINDIDIYICPVERQSGLGAIMYCLRLGKKIYITGKNYDWIVSQGAKVFHFDLLKKGMSFDDFSQELPQEVKLRNYQVTIEKRTGQVEKWHAYLKTIDQA